jgi:hypothetical protein
VIDALARVGDDHHAMRADHGEGGLMVGALSGTVPLAAREEVAMTESVKSFHSGGFCIPRGEY